MTEQRPPVVVSLNVEWPSGSEQGYGEIDRDAWDAMSPRKRAIELSVMADEHAANSCSWGWHIEDPADLAATED